MDGKNVRTTLLRVPIPIAIGIIGKKQFPLPCDKIKFLQSLLITLLCTLSYTTVGQQRQLIVLKKEEVLARYQKGDVIHFARKGDTEILIQRILDLNDTLLMMNFDSVTYYRIKKLDISGKQRRKATHRLGLTMIAAAVVLPLADLINTGLVQHEEATVSKGVAITSASLAGGGTALAFMRKPYFKPGRKYRLLIVDKRSPFYKEKSTTEGFVSPYIPKD